MGGSCPECGGPVAAVGGPAGAGLAEWLWRELNAAAARPAVAARLEALWATPGGQADLAWWRGWWAGEGYPPPWELPPLAATAPIPRG